MLTDLFNFLLIAGVIQGFGFNIATLFSKKKVDKTILFLNMVVLFLSLNNLQAWLIDNQYILPIPFISKLLVPWHVAITPMFYLFLIHYLRIESKVYSFFVPSVLLFGVEILLRGIMINYSEEISLNLNGDSFWPQYTAMEERVNAAYSLFLFVKCILIFNKKRLYQFILIYDDITWIKRFLYLGSTVFIFWIIAIVVNGANGDITNPITYYPLRLSTSGLLYWIGYQGFFRYTVVNDRILLRHHLSQQNLEGEVAKKKEMKHTGGLVNEKQKRVFEEINHFVLSENKYLDPNLSLEAVAKEQKISTSQLSLIINKYGNQHFSDYINHPRVEKAKQLLTNTEFDRYTIVAIGLECGFNSKSTFYSAFKKFTGQTPTEYKNQRLKAS